MYSIQPASDLEEQIKAMEEAISNQKRKLASLRRQLPAVEVPNYTFASTVGDVRLREMFRDKHELILVSNMGKSCRYCTLWGDNYNGIAAPLGDRAAFVVASPDSVEVQKEFARDRNWNFPMVSHAANDWAANEGFKIDEDRYGPGVVSYTKDADGRIFRHARTGFGPGDNFCNMWDFIDLLPTGVNDWAPKYNY